MKYQILQKRFSAKHNSAYWQNKMYLGIGPSAHLFDGKKESGMFHQTKIYRCNK